MTEEEQAGFAGRGFVSVLTAVSFVVLALSGIVLLVAHGPGLGVLGIGGAQWKMLHLWFSLIFVTASVIHIWLNWSRLVGYFKNRATQHWTFRREWLLAVALCALVFGGTVGNIFPFSADGHNPATITLAEVAVHQGSEPAQLLADLKAKGINVASVNTTIGEIAASQGVSSEELFGTVFGRPGRGH
jgi:hypothetical protein